MDTAASLLNDKNKLHYTYEKMLPFLKIAWTDLQESLRLQGIDLVHEKSSVIPVTSGTTEVTLPSDFVSPIYLEERETGGSEDSWLPMHETSWEPSMSPTDNLRFWAFREDKVYLIGATRDREVRLRYVKGLGPMTSEITPIPIANYDNYLSKQTAAYSAEFIGENPDRAGKLFNLAAASLGNQERSNIKGQQGTPAKRKPFWHHRRGRWLSR